MVAGGAAVLGREVRPLRLLPRLEVHAGPSTLLLRNTKGYSSTYLAMGFANVRSGTQNGAAFLGTRPNISESQPDKYSSTRLYCRRPSWSASSRKTSSARGLLAWCCARATRRWGETWLSGQESPKCPEMSCSVGVKRVGFMNTIWVSVPSCVTRFQDRYEEFEIALLCGYF